jgi:hypothetical protein
MIRRIVVILAFVTAVPIWAQVSTPDAGNESPMVAPPPVSGQAFSSHPTSEERSNYLTIGLMGEVAYVSNVLPGSASVPVNDETYSIRPSLSFDRSSLRLRESFSYNPGFMFYQTVTALNQSTENASGSISYRTSPHTNLSVSDSFLKSSNVFNQPFSLATGTVSGSQASQAAIVITPFADVISNNGTTEFTYQISETGMLGVSGGVTELDYPNPTQAPGLYNANGYSGTGFYNTRLSKRQYIGASYEYANVTENGSIGNISTATNAVDPFYTFYPQHNISFSVSVGPQYYSATVPQTGTVSGWSPSVVGSMHVGTPRATYSASYQRTVTGGGGLIGAFTMQNGSLDARVQLSRTWGTGFSMSYVDEKNVLPMSVLGEQGGHMFMGVASVERHLGQHATAELGYDYLREHYSAIQAINLSPNSQRVYITISYTLRRPLGR